MEHEIATALVDTLAAALATFNAKVQAMVLLSKGVSLPPSPPPPLPPSLVGAPSSPPPPLPSSVLGAPPPPPPSLFGAPSSPPPPLLSSVLNAPPPLPPSLLGAPSSPPPSLFGAPSSPPPSLFEAPSSPPPPYTPPLEISIPLWASEVGAYLGKDQWLPRDKALARVWRRSNEGQYLAALAAWKPPTEELYPNIRTTADIAHFRQTATPAQAAKLYKAKGISQEEAVAALFAASIQQPVVLRHAAVEWQSVPGAAPLPCCCHRPAGPVTTPGPFTVTGQVDGWLHQPPHAGVIVEIKLRMGSRLPPSIPDRDLLQLQTYMHINHAEECVYVQCVFGTEELHTQHYCRDRVYWEHTILPGLCAFVCEVRGLLRGDAEDAALRTRVLCAAEEYKVPVVHVAAADTAAPAASSSSSSSSSLLAPYDPSTWPTPLSVLASVACAAGKEERAVGKEEHVAPRKRGPAPPPFRKMLHTPKRRYVQICQVVVAAMEDVQTVGVKEDVQSVVGIMEDVQSVVGIMEDVQTVVGIMEDVQSVVKITEDVQTELQDAQPEVQDAAQPAKRVKTISAPDTQQWKQRSNKGLKGGKRATQQRKARTVNPHRTRSTRCLRPVTRLTKRATTA